MDEEKDRGSKKDNDPDAVRGGTEELYESIETGKPIGGLICLTFTPPLGMACPLGQGCRRVEDAEGPSYPYWLG